MNKNSLLFITNACMNSPVQEMYPLTVAIESIKMTYTALSTFERLRPFLNKTFDGELCN